MNNKLILILLLIFIFNGFLSFAQNGQEFCEGVIIYPQEDYNICNSNPWVVVFDDEFKTLNTNTWNQWAFNDIPCYSTQQYYSYGENTMVENGILKIWGEEVESFWSKVDRNKDKTAIISCPESGQFVNWQKFSYKSDKIETRRAFSYGKFEARVRFSVGNGIWPAFWLWSGDESGGYREIDIVEIMDNSFSHYNMSIHYNYNGEGRDMCTDHEVLNGFLNKWHVLGMTYEKDYIVWYVDYVEVGRVWHYYSELGQEIGCELNGWTPYYMNKIYPKGEAMNVQINLAIYDDGEFGPYDNFYETVEVDWVKIYNRYNPYNVTVADQSDYQIIKGKYNTILGQSILFDCDYDIPEGEFLRVQADNSIRILPGFVANANSEIQLVIDNNSDNLKSSNSQMFVEMDYAESPFDINTKNLEKNSFNISPNPTNGMITLNIENIENSNINIVDCSGDVIHRINEIKSNSILLDLSFLQNGVYLVQLSNKESGYFETKKLIIL